MITRYPGKLKKSGFFGFVVRKDGIYELHYNLGVIKLFPVGVNPDDGRENCQQDQEWYVPGLFELGYFFKGVCNESSLPIKPQYTTTCNFFPEFPVVNADVIEHHMFYPSSSTPQIIPGKTPYTIAYIIQYGKLVTYRWDVINPTLPTKTLLFSTKKVEL